MKKVLEVIAFTPGSCKDIMEAGAHRVELCDNPGDGGTTPSYGCMKQARACCTIPIYPIIRPRGGDFLYDDVEFKAMLDDIEICKALGMDGIVTGILTRNGEVDEKRNRQLVEAAGPMGVTFHRAFDRVENRPAALEQIIALGFERVLTSGGQPTAEAGAAAIAALIQQADNRIIIMPGSGIRGANIAAIASSTGAVEFHSSARCTVPGNMEYHNPAMQESTRHIAVEVNEIKLVLAALNEEY